MTERPPTAPSEDSVEALMLSWPAPKQATSPHDHSPLESLPLTPPHSPPSYPQTDSKASLDTTASRRSTRSHQEYLDSLKPPSDQDFIRLASVQEQRAKERKQHARELRRQSADIARKSLEARKDFMETKQQHHLHNLLEHARPSSSSRGDDSAAQGGDDDGASVKSQAATVIQRTYRGYRVRREIKGLSLDANTRWTHTIRDLHWTTINTPRPRNDSLLSPGSPGTSEEAAKVGQRPRSNTSGARQKWKKAAAIARRAGGDEDSPHSDEDSDTSSDEEVNAAMTEEQHAAARKRRADLKANRQKHAKMMGLQYFLEMVDLKHRYGSNLRQYHEEWKKADTKENFFYWLDVGDGRNVELTTCPRERLDKEQVRYLNREERQHYLVKVDKDGRLCWAKNGILIDTTEQWKDSINGIVPATDQTPAFEPTLEEQYQTKDSPVPWQPEGQTHPDSENDSETSESELEAARAAKYATPTLDEAKGVKKVRHVSAATIFNKLLRKSVRKGTWIFVADTSFRLYVGIKDSGAFQHSSFLHGARILAAGLIKIKEGRLSSLSPLSGHYRPPASNFRAFVHSLKDEGVDMSHVSISKSYAVLVGLEAYIKTRQKGKETLQSMTHRKVKLLDPVEAERREEAEKDNSASAAREREILEKQEVERDENRVGVKFMQKLGLRPRAATHS